MPFYSYPNPITPNDVQQKSSAKHHRKHLHQVAYTIMMVSLLVYGMLAITEYFMADAFCDREFAKQQQNVDYPLTPCHFDKQIWLLGMSRVDCMFARRMMFASLLGAVIGWERRAVDRPAGMRTMSLVCMGACLFTITSIFGFIDGPMNWDASRVSAAIPSGVGFLGAGLIWKTTTGEGQNSVHQIHGLTTAASVWLSASIGVAVGGGYYFVSVYSVILIVKVLKYGPRIFYQEDDAARYDSESEIGGDDSTAGSLYSDMEDGTSSAETSALLPDTRYPYSTDFTPARSHSFPKDYGSSCWKEGHTGNKHHYHPHRSHSHHPHSNKVDPNSPTKSRRKDKNIEKDVHAAVVSS